MPDLTTRRGLKKVHADFARIYDRMNTMYNKNLDKEKVTGGIVGIWAKMSTDSILRNKLFEKGKFSIHHRVPHARPQPRRLSNRSSRGTKRVVVVSRFLREALATP